VFDLMFHEPRDASGDRRFAESIASAGNVVLLDRTEEDFLQVGSGGSARLERRTPPLPLFKSGALGSAAFVLPTVPVRVGQFWTFGRATTDTPSLPALAVQAHLLPHYEAFLELVEHVQPGATAEWPQSRSAVVAQRSLESAMSSIRRTFQGNPRLAAAARARLARESLTSEQRAGLESLLALYAGSSSRYLNYYGPARAVPTLPYDRVLSGSGALDVAGKVAFVGLSESRQSEQQDDFYSVFSARTGVNLSGVEMGATAFANLVEQRALLPLPMPAQLALLLGLGVALGTALALLSLRGAIVVALVGSAAYFALGYWQFASHFVWLPLAVPLLVQVPLGFGVAAWWSYRDVSVQRERVRAALGYYVPRSLATRLAEQTVSLGAGRQLLHGTCLFTDAEQYTAVAERLRPEALAAFMNDYYRALFRVVEQHGGEISDTAGDSMVAVWASAEPDPAARARATQAALAILAAVDDFNRAQRIGRLPTRVGLESGELLLGNIGAEQRYEYRAIGDIVNTAARIQELNRSLGTRVLVSAATLDGTEGLPARAVGTFLLRGKRLPVAVHEPLAAGVCALDGVALAEFAAALAAFRAADWEDAAARFGALVARVPADGPSRYYEALATRYRREPPGDWTGAVRLGAK
jgi:adenylate cyclase